MLLQPVVCVVLLQQLVRLLLIKIGMHAHQYPPLLLFFRLLSASGTVKARVLLPILDKPHDLTDLVRLLGVAHALLQLTPAGSSEVLTNGSTTFLQASDAFTGN